MANESDRMTTNQLKEAQTKHVGEIDKYNPRTGEIITSKTRERKQIDNELQHREKEEKKIAELAKLEADLRDEIKQNGNGAGRINTAATLANVSQELKERREQYNADNGITEAQVASTSQKNHGSGAAVAATVNVQKPQPKTPEAIPDKPINIKGKGDVANMQYVGKNDEDVASLQALLNKVAGKQVAEVDGQYGNQTRKAVEDLQKKHNLKVDGVAGPETYAKLIQEANKVDLAKSAGVLAKNVTGGVEAKSVRVQNTEQITANIGPNSLTR